MLPVSGHQDSIKLFESVQCKFAKRLYGLTNVSYKGRLALLYTDSLEIRRLCFDFIIVYKILFIMVVVSAPQFFTRVSSSYYTRGRHKLVFNYSPVDVRKYFFLRASTSLNNGTHSRRTVIICILFTNLLKRTDMGNFRAV